MTSAMAMQSAEVAPTDRQVAAVTRAKADATPVLAKWKAITTTELAALNAKRKAAGQPAIALP